MLEVFLVLVLTLPTGTQEILVLEQAAGQRACSAKLNSFKVHGVDKHYAKIGKFGCMGSQSQNNTKIL